MNKQVENIIRTVFKPLTSSEPTINIEHDSDIDIELISITTEDKQTLLENNSEVSHAISYLVKKMIEQQGLENNLVLNINNEQKKVIEETKQKAEIAYQRVLTYGKPYEFGFLNGFERMIIHSFLKDKTEVRTQSSGVGKSED
jgi:predicted RNA-binding protein Jag